MSAENLSRMAAMHESVSSWRGKDGVGCEIKNCADADTKVMLQLEIQEARSCVLENMLQELRKYFASPSPGMGVGGPLVLIRHSPVLLQH